MEKKELVILSGVAGSGKSTALKTFEDLGYYCVDNLPPELIQPFVNFILSVAADTAPDSDIGQYLPATVATHFALLVRCRDEKYETLLHSAMKTLEEKGVSVSLLYFDCDDEIVIRRYRETRRPHPLLVGNSKLHTMTEALAAERGFLRGFRSSAERVFDTTALSPHQLRRVIEEFVGQSSELQIDVISFGFKYGVPQDIDMLLDVRFLPNPYFNNILRSKTGNDPAVRDYVFSFPETSTFLTKYMELIEFLLPQYVKEGKRYLTLAIGCTGGKHRSVALANEIYARLLELDFNCRVSHRNLGLE